jgi:hypothetical protein
MNWDMVEVNWQFPGKVKTQWGDLTDQHPDMIAGKRVELWAGAGGLRDPRTTKPSSRSRVWKREPTSGVLSRYEAS